MTSPIELANTMLGKGEVPDQATIQRYLQTGGAGMNPATQAWCAAFVNSTLQQSGIKGTGSNMARSFLQFGVPITTPERGDIAVFKRGNDPRFGHVGFFEGVGPDGKIQVLGGNQGDAVSVKGFSPADLLGYRRPSDAPVAAPAVAAAAPATASPEVQQMAGMFGNAPLVDGGGHPAPDTGLDPLAMLATGLPGMQAQNDDAAELQRVKDKARREALFGVGGIADMFG